MPKLSYITNTSLDLYIEDAQGNFQFTEPSEEVFAFITDLARPLGTWLYGRRLYETMAVWETEPTFAAESELSADFARVWQDADKIVYSTTLDAPLTKRTTIERAFDPNAVRALKESATSDLTIGGAQLAAEAFKSGLVDEVHLFIAPVFLGSGKAALPQDMRADLELLDERRFDSGTIYVRYRVVPNS